MTRKILGFADEELTARLDAFKKGRGLKSRTAAISTLLNEATDSRQMPQATPAALLADTRPLIVTGQSGTGKTTAIRAALDAWDGPALILDLSDEYAPLTRVKFSDVFAMDWDVEARIRWVPTNQAAAAGEVAALLQYLVAAMHGEGRPLVKWLVVLEEGHKLSSSDPNLRTMLAESRKYLRKFLVATAQPGDLAELASVYSP